MKCGFQLNCNCVTIYSEKQSTRLPLISLHHLLCMIAGTQVYVCDNMEVSL